MASKVTIGATLQADGKQAGETVKSFKAQLREANQELLSMREKFGDVSPEAIKAAKSVAELKNTIGEARSLADSFNPSRNFVAFGQSVQGVVGGFTALQGVMGLIGSESEEVHQALLKVESALAISEGVDQIKEAITGFKNLGAMIKNSTLFVKANEVANKGAAAAMKLFGVSVESTSTSFKILKGAIIATGIGALVILIGEAISYFNELTSSAERAEEAQKKAIELREQGADVQLKSDEETLNRQEKLNVARAKNTGESEQSIFEIEQDIRQQRKRSLLNYIDEVGADSAKADEAKAKLRDLDAEMEAAALDFQTGINQKKLDEQKKLNEKEKAEAERRAAERKREHDQEVAEAKRLNQELSQGLDVSQAGPGINGEIIKLTQEYDAKKAILEKGNQSLVNLDRWYLEETERLWKEHAHKDFQDRLEEGDHKIDLSKSVIQRQLENEEYQTEAAKQQAAARKMIDEQEHKAKEEMVDQTAGLLDSAAELAGKSTAGGKALAIASTLIATYSAAQKAYESQMSIPDPSAPIRAAIAAATAVVAGIARVKAIASVPVPHGGGASTPSVSGGAPLSPSLSNSTTQLNPNQVAQINNQGNQAIKAFVVETDITNNQERISRINRAARLS